ncbi:hypothetical protein Pan181_04380 [Aeoliella mucimassa]|uniref:Uncharacterized protein n=1 Tax=Aeoliella mucimassa TaxID=2527972 RepID=A0A518AHP6_9BACT|nr:hypothetical protein Pan181_04380 [Aeoliella mucimassa]
MVSFGIVTLVILAVGLTTLTNQGLKPEEWIAMAILASIGTLLLTFGIRQVRIAERSESNSTEATNDHFKTLQNRFVEDLSKHPTIRSSTHASLQHRFANFDLGRLNLWGWLLFLATLTFLGLEIAVVVTLFAGNIDRRLMHGIGLVLLITTVGFFAAAKSLLAAVGISIWLD